MSADEPKKMFEYEGSDVKILPPEEGAPAGNVFRVEAPDGEVYHAYRYPHPAVAATVVLRDRRRGAFLLIQRAIEPHRGCFSFPGGFLDVGAERIEQTAARELFEETGVRVEADNMRLVDVRSDPDRDPRDHVFDIGFFAEVDAVDAAALDETTAVRWARAEEIDSIELAFDHNVLWRRTREIIRMKDSASS